MRLKNWIVILAGTSVMACGASNKSSNSGEEKVQMSHAVAEDEPVAPGPNPQRKEAPEDSPEGAPIEMFTPNSGDSFVTSTGISVDVPILEVTPKGGEFELEFSKGEEVKRVSHSGAPLYFEGVAFGQLFRVSSTGDLATIDFQRASSDGPVDLNSAAQVAIPTMNEAQECQGSQGVAMQAEKNGTVLIHGTKEPSSREVEGKQVVCTFRVGLYSREIIHF